MNSLYLKNTAGDITKILHNPKEETFLDLRQKLQKILNIDDPLRIHFLDNIDNIDNIHSFDINYIVIDVKIVYIKRVLDPVSDYYYDHYIINISIDEDNYECYFYYNDYCDIFMSPDDIKAFEHIILEVDYELCTSYTDLKTLLLNTKIIPTLYREKVAHMAYNKWCNKIETII